ncbi:AraC family transcriptional regulator [Nonlabens spongiae]|uniref:AraC family transcriptional regulator n=1 Tax=Nonlabens spongiae TaxID=331648 RepID=A0A1W6MKI3_9FLAO|nr:helix-turn-helix domain-containing protein [Nonlabens spongiae]ARN78087.1 AraC family transcriptional regulator [Nonlabens spongiae]
MKLDYQHNRDGGRFTVTDFTCNASLEMLKDKKLFKIIWCRNGKVNLQIDGYKVELIAGQVLFCTPVNQVDIPKNNHEIVAYLFNREFYCILQNDSEVSCMGMLFYGSKSAPIADLNDKDIKNFEAILVLLKDEFQIKDLIQGEMLRTLLKRMLITATRLIRNQQFNSSSSIKQIELIRKFHILVEQHFKEKHAVADYAKLLYKSPKTLSNFFKKHEVSSPLKIINDRIISEAKRLLLNSNLSAEEIGYELGYKEPSHFSKFFKKHVGMSPLSFRKS